MVSPGHRRAGSGAGGRDRRAARHTRRRPARPRDALLFELLGRQHALLGRLRRRRAGSHS